MRNLTATICLTLAVLVGSVGDDLVGRLVEDVTENSPDNSRRNFEYV